MAGKILVIDDDDSLRRIIVKLLTKEGYAVEEAESAEVASGRLDEIQPGMIILDIMMPGMDGYTFCQKLQDTAHADVPVLMLTARRDMVDKFKGYMAGAVDYMTKPFKNTELLDKVRSLYKY